MCGLHEAPYELQSQDFSAFVQFLSPVPIHCFTLDIYFSKGKDKQKPLSDYFVFS